ncbi:MAG TPA: LuxR C-terminal-related transcriptional regulator [Acidimicrobiales bacterium]|nr:LuxR C-terminal-related transcriptional regulator [Acidimicrobiales bacterium]
MAGISSSGDVLRERAAESQHDEAGTLEGAAASPRGRGQRVLVVDTNLLTAQAVVAALSQLDFNARFALPATAEHVRALGSWHPNVALVDIDSIGTDAALACIRTLTVTGVPTAVVTSSLDTPLAGESVHAGAISVVHKGSPLIQLVQILLRIVDGVEVLSEPLKSRLLEGRSRLAPFEILTQREKFVLSRLMEGLSAETIARGSGVSISTVRSQIKAILQKLGVNSQLAAASLARQVGWTFAPPQEPAAPKPPVAAWSVPTGEPLRPVT